MSEILSLKQFSFYWSNIFYFVLQQVTFVGIVRLTGSLCQQKPLNLNIEKKNNALPFVGLKIHFLVSLQKGIFPQIFKKCLAL